MYQYTIQLLKELVRNIRNNYREDNWDSERFGPYSPSATALSLPKLTKIGLSHLFRTGLATTYGLLSDDYSRAIFVKVMAYRVLGHQRVKLPLNSPYYWNQLALADRCRVGPSPYVDPLYNWALDEFNLNEIAWPLTVYSRTAAIATIFQLEHYEYHRMPTTIGAQRGDYVIDAGGAWGDTALYFAEKVGAMGKVFSFEFVPQNLEIFRSNLALNPTQGSRVEIIEQPLGAQSGMTVFFANRGPGTKVATGRNTPQDFEAITTSIDDFVRMHNISHVDFIKMDIEGAELSALQGASETIRRFRPRLAICLYHSLRDFETIPSYLASLGCGYDFFVDHFTIHREETVLFAFAP